MNKISSKKLVCLTAYTAPMAKILDAYCDYLLVGDSVAMVLYGEETTRSATLDMMIRHGKAVSKHTRQAKVIIDLPYGTYEESPALALESAQKILGRTDAYGVKLEGGQAIKDHIALLRQNNIPVMGHIGLLPQHVSDPNGFKVQGKEKQAAQDILEDAMSVAQAGAFAAVVEAVPESLAARITQAISIPTIGIGASAACDGQILVTEDMIGLSGDRVPKFVKQYADMKTMITSVVEQYHTDVKTGAFPETKHVYRAS